LLAKDVSCLERVENESDRQIDEHELRPRRRCVATTSAPAISTVTSAKRRLTYALPLSSRRRSKRFCFSVVGRSAFSSIVSARACLRG
jgi:hypothetical protein